MVVYTYPMSTLLQSHRAWVLGLLCVGVVMMVAYASPQTADAQVLRKIMPECPADTGCRACDLVTLANNVMQFLIIISVFIAMVIVAWAGLKYVVSGGSASELGSMLSNIIVGIVIMLCAWLIVDTVIKYLTGGTFGPWNKIECVNNPTLKKFAEKLEPYGNGDTGIDGRPQNPVDPAKQGTGDCSPEALSGFGSGAAGMSCIAQKESNCNPAACGDNGFSCGIFQINMTAHPVTCNGQTLNCPSAFSGMYTGSNRNVTIKPGMEGLAAQCKTALQDPACNQQVAQGIYNRQGFGPWSTAGACGLR